ncbi:hypothetical protein PIB30_034660 [Stylosanthes scabra]|uniref:Uncharacterized protein n=1 Tax=Stylosanthes scabra TaxID=79078 RepID=A0ABU6QD70_9FABA|nr:hypothetical protein [Stylosanthes scabra]
MMTCQLPCQVYMVDAKLEWLLLIGTNSPLKPPPLYIQNAAVVPLSSSSSFTFEDNQRRFALELDFRTFVALMEENNMEDKESASFGDGCRSASCGSQMSNAGGEFIRRGENSSPLDAGVEHMPFCFNPPPVATLIGFSLTSTPQCRYFAWLNEYVSSFAVNEAANKEEVLQDMLKLEEKIASVQRMVAKSND